MEQQREVVDERRRAALLCSELLQRGAALGDKPLAHARGDGRVELGESHRVLDRRDDHPLVAILPRLGSAAYV